jgi:peptide/nickel transport system permease protein
MFSRLIYAARNTMGIAVLTTAVSFTVGGLLGLLAAVLRGWVDQIVSRIVDVMMSIPQLIFCLVLLSFLGTSVLNLVVIIGILDPTGVPPDARGGHERRGPRFVEAPSCKARACSGS